MSAVDRAFDAIPYLRALNQTERAVLAESCGFRTLADGATLFVEGEPATGVFLIVRGRVKVVRTSDDGREQVLHEEGPGTTLAEVPVFDGGGYVGSAIAVGDGEVFFVERHALFQALLRNPASAAALMQVLAARIRKLAAVVEDLALRTVTERTAAFLLREMNKAGAAAFDLPATREQLAAHLGTVREQVSRALSHLRSSGAIDIEARRVRILDVERLLNLAGQS